MKYMRLRPVEALLSSLLLALSSCIQDEPLCPEAEITSFTLPEAILFSEQPVINQGRNTIQALVRPGADLSRVAPEITVNDFSSVFPESGEEVDFSEPVTYTVVAQDGIHKREYTVRLISMDNEDVYTSLMLNFDFDYWEENATYHYATPVPQTSTGLTYEVFSTSNQGVALYQQFGTPAEYPTFPLEQGDGYAAKMVTREGPGSILGIMNIPIVAGSLFTGTMNLLNALRDPLTSTQFGRPFNQEPNRFQGKYNYKAGTGTYIGPDGNPKPGMKDSCAVYAVFYKIDDTLETLDGTNIHDHPNIISVAMLPDRSSTEGDELVPFDIPFVRQSEEEVDFTRNEYKLAIVLSSSYWGDRYEGTPGSQLIVDDVKIITQNGDSAPDTSN